MRGWTPGYPHTQCTIRRPSISHRVGSPAATTANGCAATAETRRTGQGDDDAPPRPAAAVDLDEVWPGPLANDRLVDPGRRRSGAALLSRSLAWREAAQFGHQLEGGLDQLRPATYSPAGMGQPSARGGRDLITQRSRGSRPRFASRPRRGINLVPDESSDPSPESRAGDGRDRVLDKLP